MSASIGTRYPRGGSTQWLGYDAASVALRASFFGGAAQTTPVVLDSGIKGYDTLDSVTLSGLVGAAGSTVVVWAYWQQDAPVPTLSLPGFTLLFTQQVGTNSGGNWAGLWIAQNYDSTTFSITLTKSSGFPTVGVAIIGGATGFNYHARIDPGAPFSVDVTAGGPALALGIFWPGGDNDLTFNQTANGFTPLDELGSFAFWQSASATKSVDASSLVVYAPVAATGLIVAGSGVAALVFYGTDAPTAFPGYVKHYTSPTTYEMVQLQAWDGVAFVPALLKHWTGAEWKLTKGF